MRGDTGSTTRHSSGMGLTAQAARRMMIVLTILGLVTLSLGVGFTLVQRAGATPYDVCASGCPYYSINDALAAAASGSTITVGPGTYGPNEPGATTPDTQITINKSVTLQGAGSGVSIINDAPANQGKAIAGVILIKTPQTPGNITVSGFTIEGAIANGNNIVSGNTDGILLVITDANASDVVTIQNDLFYGDTTLDPQLLADQTDAIVVQGTSATTTIANTQFNGVFRAALVEGDPGPFNFTGNDINLHGLYDISTTPPTLYYWGEGILFLADNSANTTSPQVISGNTFENYLGMGVGVDAGYSGGLIGAISNMTISSNVFDNQGVLGLGSTFAAPDISMHGFGTTNGTVTSTISGVSISGNTFNQGSVAGAGSGILLKGAIGGSVSITNNVIQGIGSSRPAAGINFVSVANTAAVSVTNNIIRGYVDGGTADTIPSGAVVTASQNCISGNSSYGFSVTTGSVNAQHNWWGAAAGPGTGVGFGNPVTPTTVDASNFLTSAPQSACAGPVASNVQTNSNPLPVNSAYTLTAKLDTSTTSNAPVASAYYTLDGGAPVAMTTTSGTFGSSTLVQVTSGSLSAFSVVGTHTLCVFGTDSYGQTGSPVCMQLSVIIPSVNTTTTITSSANPSTFNQSVTITITVASGSGTPTGDVTLKDGATTLTGPVALVSGMATFITSALTVGTHPLVALYAGDSTGNPIFQPSTSATFNQVVNTIPTTTSVTASPNPSVSGQNVTFSVTVHAADSSTPTGSVTLSDGATQLGVVTLTNGAGSFSTSALSVGAHNISAAYGGDTTHSASNGSATATVTATPAVPTGSSNAYIRIVQSSETYATSDISIDGSVTFPNVAACTAQPYYPITAGAHTFTVASPSGGSTVITQSLNLTAGSYYTLAVVGNSAKSITPALLVFQDNNTVSSNQAKVRVYNLSDTLGTVQVSSGSTVVAASLAFANATGYTNQAAGTVTYSFQPTSGSAIKDTLNVSANQVYSIFLVCNSQVTNAAATGIPNALPQTGYGHAAQWLTPQEITILLIIGVILLLGGALSLGSYLVIVRRRNVAF